LAKLYVLRPYFLPSLNCPLVFITIVQSHNAFTRSAVVDPITHVYIAIEIDIDLFTCSAVVDPISHVFVVIRTGICALSVQHAIFELSLVFVTIGEDEDNLSCYKKKTLFEQPGCGLDVELSEMCPVKKGEQESN